jgi:uncharacterized MAPEG superfamily protein
MLTPDLIALILAALLWAGQLAHMAVRANLEIGSRYFLSPRDTPPPQELSQGTQRLKRAYTNHAEALLLFAIAVTAITLTGKESTASATLAFTYLVARLLFVPAYALGWTPWRSVFFGIGYLCSILLLVLALI